MADSPQPPVPDTPAQPSQAPTASQAPMDSRRSATRPSVREVRFVAYPKLLFVWPLILLGFVLYPFSAPPRVVPTATAAEQAAATAVDTGTGVPQDPVVGGSTSAPQQARINPRLEWIGWLYLWTIVLVVLTLGIDVDRNRAAFFIVLLGGSYVLGLWLRDVQGFTFFGQLYTWFAALDVQYNRTFGFALSVILLVPYTVMLLWARLNDYWRITHNEFEHYSFGKMNDSLGRGAKTIRTDYPDVFELLLGLAGTLIVFNASGTRELRRIPHVMFLPLIRKQLDKILERTAVSIGVEFEDDEDG